MSAQVASAPAPQDSPFGSGPAGVVTPSGPLTGSADLDRVLNAFATQTLGDPPTLTLSSTLPTAAFSRRDALLPGYTRAVEIARAYGFEPVVRPVGGRLAAYDEGSLVVHCHAGLADPGAQLTRRFQLFAGAAVRALTDLGVPDLRIGPVPGEYCTGEWSVNVAGRTKLAGTGQRLSRRRGYLFSAVVTVTGVDRLTAFLTEAYAALGLDFRPESVGAVTDWVPTVTLPDMQDRLTAALTPLFGRPVSTGRVRSA